MMEVLVRGNGKMRIIDVLKILTPYIRDWDYPISADRSVIIFNIYYDDIPKDVLKTLDKMGCFYSNVYHSLIMFV